jgi:hypothetical protein
MAKLVTTFVNWRATLVAVQGALAGGTLTPAEIANGYGFMQALTTSGMAYDQSGDDSPKNPGTFSVAVCQPYMDASTPAFLEMDRLARYTYALYASTATLANAQGFGLYPGATSIPSAIQQPTALAYTWLAASSGNIPSNPWNLVTSRAQQAEFMADAAGNFTLAQQLVNQQNASTVLYGIGSVPVNPNAANEATSILVTNTVNAALANCVTWLGTLTFS